MGFAAYITAPKHGVLALSAMPQTSAQYNVIAQWNPALIVSLIHPAEGPSDMAQRLAVLATHIAAPIDDYAIPDQMYPAFMGRIGHELANHGRVWVHCRAGYGRSGMVVMRALIDQGEPAQDALNRLRDQRPGAIETPQQLFWASCGVLGRAQ